MARFGREALRWWKLSAPSAFDALRDPVTHFEHIDAHCQAVAEQLAREDAARHGDEGALRFWIEQHTQSLLETMPLPPREETFLDECTEELVDPQGRFLHKEMPLRPHPLWALLEDPAVPASRFQRELRAWYETLPRAPWVEQAGGPMPVFEPNGSGELVRAGTLRQPEIRRWPQATVLTFRARGLEEAFQVLADATASGRAWAGGGYVDRSERSLVLLPWRDDGSEPDASELALMHAECGPLERGMEFVVTAGRPRVVDFHAVTWEMGTPARERRVKPWLLLDVDGVLLAEGAGKDVLDASLVAELDLLADRYELAWATSWESSANTLLKQAGRSMWPVVPLTDRASRDPDGYGSPRVIPVLDFVGQRPFAWVDDQLDRGDASMVVAGHDCLLLRPNPRRGLSGEQIQSLHAWVHTRPAN